jgi:hypothetical protein
MVIGADLGLNFKWLKVGSSENLVGVREEKKSI